MKLDENGMITDLPDDIANGIINGDGRKDKSEMTNEEAIRVFEEWIEHDKKMEYADRLENIEIYNLAIKALKQESCKDTVTVGVKHDVLTKDDIKDIDPGDDVSAHISKTIEHTISLVKEDQEKFIFNCISPFLAEINEIVIPKRVLERALFTFKEEHTAEWKVLMKEYGGTGV